MSQKTSKKPETKGEKNQPKKNGQNNQKKKGKPKKPQGEQKKHVPQKDAVEHISFVPIQNPRRTAAQGVQPNCLIESTIDLASLQGGPLSIIGVALNRGFKSTGDIRNAYLALVEDLRCIMNGEISPVNARLNYLSAILGSLSPKSVEFRNKMAQFAYKWRHVTVPTSVDYIDVRGYRTYLYNLNVLGAPSGAWNTQDPCAASPGEEENLEMLSQVFSQLVSERSNCLKLVLGNQLTKEYSRDVSAFSCSQEMWGGANSAYTGPYRRVLSEVPTLSGLLSVWCDGTSEDRAPRVYKTSAGDSTFTLGLGLLPGFKKQWYKTVYSPNIKFLDMHELVTLLIYWYKGLTTQGHYATDGGPYGGAGLAYTPFPFTARQFALAVRANIMALFGDTQALTQFCTPTITTNGFEGLRVGTNSYGKAPAVLMRMPGIVVENLANLQYSVYEVKTKYENKKNVALSIPCWGAFKSYVEQNPTMDAFDGGGAGWYYPAMFAAPVATDPNVIDGTSVVPEVCDIAASPIISDIIAEWNDRIAILQEYSVPIQTPASDSRNGNLLSLTRHQNFRTVTLDKSFRTLHNTTSYISHDNKELIRKDSKGRVSEEKFLLPSGAGIGTAFSLGVSSMFPLSSALKTIINYMIIPMMPHENGVLPGQTQYRVGVSEPYRLDTETPSTAIFDTRLAQLYTMGTLCACGVAASGVDQVANMIRTMSAYGKGDYTQDALVDNSVESIYDDTVDKITEAMKLLFKEMGQLVIPFADKIKE